MPHASEKKFTPPPLARIPGSAPALVSVFLFIPSDQYSDGTTRNL